MEPISICFFYVSFDVVIEMARAVGLRCGSDGNPIPILR